MSDQITYLYFCTLGGIAHGRTYTRTINLGGKYYITYYLRRKEH